MHRKLIAAMTVLVVSALTLPAQAADIVDEWTSVKTPSAPVLKPVTVDPKTTALLMLDFMNQNCGKRPRCLAEIPAMKKLLADARAAKALVVYSLIANTTTADVIKDVAPLADEPSVLRGPGQVFQDRSREDPERQRHQDGHRRRHRRQRRGAFHRERARPCAA